MNPEYGLRKTSDKTPSRFRWWYIIFVLLLTVACLTWATQEVAAALGWHPALGNPLLYVGAHPVYAPWRLLIWHNQFPSSAALVAAMDTYGTRALLVWVAPQFIILMLAMQRKPKGRSDLHGSAHWATDKEIQATGLLHGKGVFVGSVLSKNIPCALRHNGPEHVLTFAPTRSGKGIGVILPTLLTWGESSMTLDIKGENYALTSAWMESQGIRVLRFEPSDPSGTAACFNPLEEIRLDSPFAISDTQNIATIIVDQDGSGLKDYWLQASYSFLGGAILHCLIMTHYKEGRFGSLYDLSNMLADPARDISAVLNEMLEIDHAAIVSKLFPQARARDCNAIHMFIAASSREMLNKSENEMSGVLGTAGAKLSLYRDPVVALNTDHSDFHVRDLVDGATPSALYLVLSPSHTDRLKPLTRLMVNLIIHRLTEKMEFKDGKTVKRAHRLLLMLDELAALGKLDVLERALAYMAGYGLKAFIIVQNNKQLNDAYGPNNSIMDNCHVRVAYAANTPETAKLLSEMVGTTTVVDTKTSLSGSRSGRMKNASVNISETSRPLLTPDECMRIPGLQHDDKGRVVAAGNMLIFVAGHAPIYGQQILYFKVPELLTRSLMPSIDISPAYAEAKADGTAFVPQDLERPTAEQEVEQDYEDAL